MKLVSLSKMISESIYLKNPYYLKHLSFMLNSNISDWETYTQFNKKKYEKTLVYRDDKIDTFIIGWLPKQQSKLHYHSNQGCLYKCLSGQLNETIYYPNNKISKRVLLKNNISYIDNTIGGHEITNDSLVPSVSLHIYSPPTIL